MAANNTKLMMNGGAYSMRYQLLEEERFQRFKQEHKDTSRSARERAHLLSKQTQQRRRALEDKKQAMAKAEEERRKAALEERRRQQKEATERFRSAISRQPKHSKSHITLEAIHSRPRQQTPPTNMSRKNSKSSPEVISERVVYGREVEIPHPASALNMTATFGVMKDPPNLDEVLESIRGRSSDHTPSIESIILTSPEPPPQAPGTTPLFDKTTLPVLDSVPNNSNSNLSINSNNSDDSTISLHDSIDEPIQVTHNRIETIEVNDKDTGVMEEESSSTITDDIIETRPLTNEEHSLINDNQSLIDEESSNLNQTEEIQDSQKKGILKKASCSSMSRSSTTSGKRVRFSETLHERQRYFSRTNIRDSSSVLIPKMRISLNNKLGSAQSHQVLSSTVTKLGSGRNGIVIHVPAQTNGVGGVYHHPSMDTVASNNVWSSMGAYIHEEPMVTHQERKYTSSNARQLPVKLWKKPSKSQAESAEEKRLMESIELINNRLRALPTNEMSPINMEPSVMDPPYVTRYPPTPQYKRQLTKPSPTTTRHRTRYK